MENEVGTVWSDFSRRRGDWRRDLVLHIGRMHGGMTLADLAWRAKMHLDMVTKAVRRMHARLPQDRRLRAHHGRVLRSLDREDGLP